MKEIYALLNRMFCLAARNGNILGSGSKETEVCRESWKNCHILFLFLFCFVLIELSLRNSGALCIILGSINMFLSVSTKVNKTKSKKLKMKYVLYEK